MAYLIFLPAIVLLGTIVLQISCRYLNVPFPNFGRALTIFGSTFILAVACNWLIALATAVVILIIEPNSESEVPVICLLSVAADLAIATGLYAFFFGLKKGKAFRLALLNLVLVIVVGAILYGLVFKYR